MKEGRANAKRPAFKTLLTTIDRELSESSIPLKFVEINTLYLPLAGRWTLWFIRLSPSLIPPVPLSSKQFWSILFWCKKTKRNEMSCVMRNPLKCRRLVHSLTPVSVGAAWEITRQPKLSLILGCTRQTALWEVKWAVVCFGAWRAQRFFHILLCVLQPTRDHSGTKREGSLSFIYLNPLLPSWPPMGLCRVEQALVQQS